MRTQGIRFTLGKPNRIALRNPVSYGQPRKGGLIYKRRGLAVDIE
jgi:hypothetical protein